VTIHVTIHVTIATIPLTRENLCAVCGSVLQCVAVCCSVLQCVAVFHSVLQCVALCCSAPTHRHMLCMYVSSCVCACVCARTRACVCVCVCVYIFFLSYTQRMCQYYIFIFDIHAPIHIYTHPRTHICSSHSFNHPLSFSLSLTHTCARTFNFTPSPTHTQAGRNGKSRNKEGIGGDSSCGKEEGERGRRGCCCGITHARANTHTHP